MTGDTPSNNRASHTYRSKITPHVISADRFYPVRVYDPNGKLKYEVDVKGVKKHAEEMMSSKKASKKRSQIFIAPAQ